MKMISHKILGRLSLMVMLMLFLSSCFVVLETDKNTTDGNSKIIPQKPVLADPESIIFEGNEISLNITDYGNLYKDNQHIDVNNQEITNLSYY
ncbi:MAG: hypothetical protein ACFE9R_13065, partial [Candidatus Hermodarchaeota archaeon]